MRETQPECQFEAGDSGMFRSSKHSCRLGRRLSCASYADAHGQHTRQRSAGSPSCPVVKNTISHGEAGRERAVAVIRRVPGEIPYRLLAKLAKRGDEETCKMISIWREDFARSVSQRNMYREYTAYALVAWGLMKPQSWEAALEVLPCVSNRDPAVRRSAVEAIGNVVCRVSKAQGNRRRVVDAVAGCLGDSDHFVREAAVAALSRMSQAGDDTAAAILAATDEDSL